MPAFCNFVLRSLYVFLAIALAHTVFTVGTTTLEPLQVAIASQ